MNLKGTLPVLILRVLSAGDKHGYAVAQEIKQRSPGCNNLLLVPI